MYVFGIYIFSTMNQRISSAKYNSLTMGEFNSPGNDIYESIIRDR